MAEEQVAVVETQEPVQTEQKPEVNLEDLVKKVTGLEEANVSLNKTLSGTDKKLAQALSAVDVLTQEKKVTAQTTDEKVTELLEKQKVSDAASAQLKQVNLMIGLISEADLKVSEKIYKRFIGTNEEETREGFTDLLEELAGVKVMAETETSEAFRKKYGRSPADHVDEPEGSLFTKDQMDDEKAMYAIHLAADTPVKRDILAAKIQRSIAALNR